MAPVAALRISTVHAVATLPVLASVTATPSRSPDCTGPEVSRETAPTAGFFVRASFNARISTSNAALAAPADARCSSAASQFRPTCRLVGATAKAT